ncbi:molecular chaperone HtpG [Faecalibacillus faecis]|uniref:molecular chaperone HtpG n=1 Tax=Faecalibacillus faecis TaxID=1982628 RepID=UPI0006648618|nr:molecular chaperone HtpG [Faecalibacillus faecis]KMV79088.1 heat shock protein HtpG [Coprobacillus sp. 8_1_38FAA]RHB03430.1 molecular chaperone HtpG [Coprobacillus sp. AM42-12AC]RHH13813.1 molecular chaperone HtpG [Coprobacillus sp. AM18-4LB-d2]RHP26419.1 molecular chaperone HtpG [Coprobacillus sp. AF34-1BH]
MAEKKQFKAESKRLLDLMINSIYTHKEIFLRELISNASDATDKLYYKALTENISDINKSDLTIDLAFDKEGRTLTVTDHGIGMNKEELEEHLGTIANSGSFKFKNENESDDIDIIGQFGVGFYSAFMVAKKVEVSSRAYGSDQGYTWVSEASDGYEIFETDNLPTGTTIKLYLKDNTEEENYDEYLDQYHIESLVKKYSDYVHYPIKMDVTTSKKKEDSDEYEDVVENKTLNSMIPLWKRNKKDIKDEEYNEFYKDKFNDFSDPMKVIHTSVEGNVSYDALLFIPSQPPMNFYSNDYEKGLQLYSRGVFIMDKASDLIPEHFRFVKGLVDSQDLSLNISREMLQHDRQLKVIADRIEKKIQSELTNMLKKDRETYEKFFKNFGLQLKFGIYQSYGMLKDKLQDLLLFYSGKEEKMITLKEYVENMKEGQTEIYFASGETKEKISHLPQVEAVRDRDFDVLYMMDNVDEFMIQMMRDYDSKAFKNVAQGDLNLDSEEEKKELEKINEDNKSLLESLKEALKDKVVDVKVSNRLKSHPVCLVSDQGVSFEMEKVLNAMPDGQDVKAGRILEINPNHDIFKAIQNVYQNNADKIKDYASLLFDQALLIEGLSIEDPVAFSNKICELMIELNK